MANVVYINNNYESPYLAESDVVISNTGSITTEGGSYSLSFTTSDKLSLAGYIDTTKDSGSDSSVTGHSVEYAKGGSIVFSEAGLANPDNQYIKISGLTESTETLGKKSADIATVYSKDYLNVTGSVQALGGDNGYIRGLDVQYELGDFVLKAVVAAMSATSISIEDGIQSSIIADQSGNIDFTNTTADSFAYDSYGFNASGAFSVKSGGILGKRTVNGKIVDLPINIRSGAVGNASRSIAEGGDRSNKTQATSASLSDGSVRAVSFAADSISVTGLINAFVTTEIFRSLNTSHTTDYTVKAETAGATYTVNGTQDTSVSDNTIEASIYLAREENITLNGILDSAKHFASIGNKDSSSGMNLNASVTTYNTQKTEGSTGKITYATANTASMTVDSNALNSIVFSAENGSILLKQGTSNSIFDAYTGNINFSATHEYKGSISGFASDPYGHTVDSTASIQKNTVTSAVMYAKNIMVSKAMTGESISAESSKITFNAVSWGTSYLKVDATSATVTVGKSDANVNDNAVNTFGLYADSVTLNDVSTNINAVSNTISFSATANEKKPAGDYSTNTIYPVATVNNNTVSAAGIYAAKNLTFGGEFSGNVSVQNTGITFEVSSTSVLASNIASKGSQATGNKVDTYGLYANTLSVEKISGKIEVNASATITAMNYDSKKSDKNEFEAFGIYASTIDVSEITGNISINAATSGYKLYSRAAAIYAETYYGNSGTKEEDEEQTFLTIGKNAVISAIFDGVSGYTIGGSCSNGVSLDVYGVVFAGTTDVSTYLTDKNTVKKYIGDLVAASKDSQAICSENLTLSGRTRGYGNDYLKFQNDSYVFGDIELSLGNKNYIDISNGSSIYGNLSSTGGFLNIQINLDSSPKDTAILNTHDTSLGMDNVGFTIYTDDKTAFGNYILLEDENTLSEKQWIGKAISIRSKKTDKVETGLVYINGGEVEIGGKYYTLNYVDNSLILKVNSGSVGDTGSLTVNITDNGGFTDFTISDNALDMANGYIIQYRKTGAAEWESYTYYGKTSYPVTCTAGLMCGEYEYRVAALLSSGGQSAWTTGEIDSVTSTGIPAEKETKSISVTCTQQSNTLYVDWDDYGFYYDGNTLKCKSNAVTSYVCTVMNETTKVEYTFNISDIVTGTESTLTDTNKDGYIREYQNVRSELVLTNGMTDKNGKTFELVDGTSYTVTVTTFGDKGQGQVTGSTSAIYGAGITIEAPKNLESEQYGVANNVSWTCATTPGMPIKYVVEYSTDKDFARNVIRKDESITDTELLLTGLANYETYYWRVQAVSVKDNTVKSAWSETSEFHVYIKDEHGPVNVEITSCTQPNANEFDVSVEWNKAQDYDDGEYTSGLAEKPYEIVCYSVINGTESTIPYIRTGRISDLNATLKGLAPGDYKVYLNVYDVAGHCTTDTKDITVTTSVDDLKCTEVSSKNEPKKTYGMTEKWVEYYKNCSYTISWDGMKAEDNLGFDFNYEILYSTDSTFATYESITGFTLTSDGKYSYNFTVTEETPEVGELLSGETYYFKVVEQAANTQEPTYTYQKETVMVDASGNPEGIPAANWNSPGSISSVAAKVDTTKNTATFIWGAAEQDKGVPIAGYVLQLKNGNVSETYFLRVDGKTTLEGVSGKYTIDIQASAGTYTFTTYELDSAALKYSYSMSAINQNYLEGAKYSDTLSVVDLSAPQPSNLIEPVNIEVVDGLSGGAGRVTVSWNSDMFIEASPGNLYQWDLSTDKDFSNIVYSTGKIDVEGKNPTEVFNYSYTYSDLQDGTTYYWRLWTQDHATTPNSETFFFEELYTFTTGYWNSQEPPTVTVTCDEDDKTKGTFYLTQPTTYAQGYTFESYHIQMATDADFSDLVIDVYLDEPVTDWRFELENPTSELYYWRANVSNTYPEDGNIKTSKWVSDNSSGAPGVIDILAPRMPEEEKAITVNNINTENNRYSGLIYFDVAAYEDMSGIEYTLNIYADSEGKTLVATRTITREAGSAERWTEIIPAEELNLSQNSTYYWQLKVADTSKQKNASDLVSGAFYTGYWIPQEAPSGLSVSTGSTTNDTIFTWTIPGVADGLKLAKYTLSLTGEEKSPTFTITVNNDGTYSIDSEYASVAWTETEISVTVQGKMLDDLVNYKWNVTATNNIDQIKKTEQVSDVSAEKTEEENTLFTWAVPEYADGLKLNQYTLTVNGIYSGTYVIEVLGDNQYKITLDGKEVDYASVKGDETGTEVLVTFKGDILEGLAYAVNVEYGFGASVEGASTSDSVEGSEFVTADVTAPLKTISSEPLVSAHIGSVDFAWSSFFDKSQPVTYKLEISRDETFKTPISAEMSYTVTGGAGEIFAHQFDGLTNGIEYYWRLTAVDSSKNLNTSQETGSFKTKVSPGTPDGLNCTLISDELISYKFSWNATWGDVSNYTVQISTDSAFAKESDIQTLTTTGAETYIITNSENNPFKLNGYYYWRVCANADATDSGSWSSVQTYVSQIDAGDSFDTARKAKIDETGQYVFYNTVGGSDDPADFFLFDFTDKAGEYTFTTTAGSLNLYDVNQKKISCSSGKGVNLASGKYFVSISNKNLVQYQFTTTGLLYPERDKDNDDPTKLDERYKLVLNDGTGVNGWVGVSDPVNYYYIKEDFAGSITISVSASTDPDMEWYFNSNNLQVQLGTLTENGVFKAIATAKYSKAADSYSITKQLDLKTTKYYIKVVSADNGKNKNSNYNLSYSGRLYTLSTYDDNTPLDTGVRVLTENTPIASWVGFGDNVDFYSFTVGETAGLYTFTLQAPGTEGTTFTVGNICFQIGMVDEKGNFKAITTGKKVTTSENTQMYTLDRQLSQGTYYVKVYSTDGGKTRNSDYQVGYTVQEYSLSDKTNNTPKDVIAGIAAGTQQPLVPNDSEKNKVAWVGYDDAVDFYQLNVTEYAGLCSLKIFNPEIPVETYKAANLRIQIGTYDAEKDKFTALASGKLNSSNQYILDRQLAIGTYYVKVYSADNGKTKNSVYELSYDLKQYTDSNYLNNTPTDTLSNHDTLKTQGFVLDQLVAAPGISVSQTIKKAWLGFEDPVDYYELDFSRSGSFTVRITDAEQMSNLRIEVGSYDIQTGKYKTVYSASPKNGILVISSKNLKVVDDTQYFVKVSAADKGKKQANNSYYSMEVSAVYYDSNNKDDTIAKLKENYPDERMIAAGESSGKDWIGYGDSVDFYNVQSFNGQCSLRLNTDSATAKLKLSFCDANGKVLKTLSSSDILNGKTLDVSGLSSGTDYYAMIQTTNEDKYMTYYTLKNCTSIA